jgi:hypothetical protein
MFERATEFGLGCNGGYCTFKPSLPVNLADAPAPSVVITSPAFGAEFSSSDAFAVEAAGPQGVYVFVVTSQPPKELWDLNRYAVWVATRLNPTVVRFRDGYAPTTGADPMDLPANQVLYATVLRYDPAHLVGSSAPLPFVVGRLPRPGDPCADAGVFPGTCATPARVQGCTEWGYCDVVCASDRDCPKETTLGICGDPDSLGHRICYLRSAPQ